MSRIGVTVVKFGTFAVISLAFMVFLVMIFGQYRHSATNSYSAVFADVSSLRKGDSVRVSGVRVGTVNDVSLQRDQKVLVTFSADRDIVLTEGTRAAVRYLNLVGDRYLELIDSPGSTRTVPAGARIPLDRTAPALDLDALLGGLKPVIQGLNPQEVNALTASLIKIFQGQGDTVESLFSKTSSFTNALADNGAVLKDLIDNLNSAMATLSADGDRFSTVIDRLHRLIADLSHDRDPIGDAIESLSKGTASLADLLTEVRPPLAATVSELNRLATNIDGEKDRIDTALQKAPENYRKLARIGSYGSFFNYYLCGVAIRVSDLQGRTAEFPWIEQNGGRCAEPQ